MSDIPGIGGWTAMAALLRRMSVRSGERVGILTLNDHRFILARFKVPFGVGMASTIPGTSIGKPDRPQPIHLFAGGEEVAA